MVQSRKKRKEKPALAASHNRSWIWGRHAVLEVLEAGYWPIHELHLSESLETPALDHARSRAEALGITVKLSPSDKMRDLSRSAEHQGYLAKMLGFPYAGMEAIEGLIQDASPIPVIAVLDRIQDPHNFGAIIRSAEVLGIDAIIVGESNQADVTPAVARSSAGAVNHLSIVRVESLVRAVEHLKSLGLRLIAATEKGQTLSAESGLYPEEKTPFGILLGNEGEGIDDALLDCCDATVRIPQRGQIQSLNVAAAAAILFYETLRTRRS